LNGVINVVLGNHDERNHVQELLKYVNSVAGMVDYKNKVILTHCPIHPSQLEFRYSHNIHGHVHEISILKHPTLADYLGEKAKCFKRITDNTFIPFDVANTDYQKFKIDVMNGVELKDANGNTMSPDDAVAFISNLP
jgi:calcineurin-like phosphoesterase family protein